MQNLRSIVTETVDTKTLQGLAVEEYFEHTGFMRGDLPTCKITEERTTHLVRNSLLGQLALRTTKAADLRKRVNPGRDIPYQTLINLYLRECAKTKKRPGLKWRAAG